MLKFFRNKKNTNQKSQIKQSKDNNENKNEKQNHKKNVKNNYFTGYSTYPISENVLADYWVKLREYYPFSLNSAILHGVHSTLGHKLVGLIEKGNTFKDEPAFHNHKIAKEVVTSIAGLGVISNLVSLHPDISSFMIMNNKLAYFINGTKFVYGKQINENSKFITKQFSHRLVTKLTYMSSINPTHPYYYGLYHDWYISIALAPKNNFIITMNKQQPVPAKIATDIITQPINPKFTNHIYEKLQKEYPQILHGCYASMSAISKHTYELKIRNLLLNDKSFSKVTYQNREVTKQVLNNLFHLGIIGRLLLLHPNINAFLYNGKNLEYARHKMYTIYGYSDQENSKLVTLDDMKMVRRTITYDTKMNDINPSYVGEFGNISNWQVQINRLDNNGNAIMFMAR